MFSRCMTPSHVRAARRRAVLALLLALPCGCAQSSSRKSDAGAPGDGAKVVREVAPRTEMKPQAPAEHGGVSAQCPSAADPRFRDLEIFSPALDSNVWVRLLVPPGWKDHPKRSWPVLYLLTGHGASYESWSCDTFVEQYIGDAGVLVVMPDGTNDYTFAQAPDSLANEACKNDASPCGGTPGWYSDWYNGGDAGTPPRWETFHLTELRQILERNYGAGTARAIAGLSMGGFGALEYPARNPGLFRAAAAYSGFVDTSGSTFDELAVQATLIIAGADPNALWGDPKTDAGLAIWRAHDPNALADRLVSLPLFVSAGNGCHGPFDTPPNTCGESDVTETAVHGAVQDFVSALTKANGGELPGDVDLDLYGNGTHSWPYWDAELCRSLPLLMKALGVAYQAPSCPKP
jgi:diacylglycerol O-acyltransferase / trehalose O-mycolyltransferase / mycolyltransferase Ag85